MKCQSSICIVKDGVRGRTFEPPKGAKGVSEIWCPVCIMITQQIQFYAGETADMVRKVYNSYVSTELPKEVKLFLKAYTAEILQNLGKEL